MNWKHSSVKKNKIGLWTAVDHFKPRILGWVLGDHSAETFEPLWRIVGQWQCYFYVTNGWNVYPGFCLLYTSPSPRDRTRSRMPSSA